VLYAVVDYHWGGAIMGIRMPGISGTIDGKMIEKLIQVEKIPVEQAKKRKDAISTEKKEIGKLQSALSGLDTALNALKTKTDFYKLKVESSHPDIIDGVVKGAADLGTYEFEVRGLAKTEKELAYGFPDKDSTPVGFGFMYIERDGLPGSEITIEPGATLERVAQQINESEIGVKAVIVNTKYQPDPYRLLVVSEKSGNEAKISIDPDTTFLDFREQVTGRNLDVLFEDVPITDEDNVLDELINSVAFQVKRSEPGTRVQINVLHDVDTTVQNIKAFVEKYNEVAKFVHDQFAVNPETGKAGLLSGDSTIKTVMRQLQDGLYQAQAIGGKFGSLSEIGITTEPKTGTLKMDEAKVKASLTEDYDSVAKLFVRGREQVGVADRLAIKLKSFRDPSSGAVASRIRGLDRVIADQDKDIERRERTLEGKELSLRRRFSALESQLTGMQGQSAFLQQRLGGGAQQGGSSKEGG
jgi:flagellar hook-associated protein 2